MALEQGQTLLSLADYMLLPDEPRGEVFDGVFVVMPSPTPSHQDIAGEVYLELSLWLRAHPGAGRAFVAPLDVVLRAERPAVIVQPDVLFVGADRQSVIQDRIHGAPDLVVEVVSPSSGGRDAVSKRDRYARYGVREFWLVWPQERRIDVFEADRAGGWGATRTLQPGDTLTTPLLPGLSLDVGALFGA